MLLWPKIYDFSCVNEQLRYSVSWLRILVFPRANVIAVVTHQVKDSYYCKYLTYVSTVFVAVIEHLSETYEDPKIM